MEIFCAKCSGNVSRLKLHGYPNEEVRVCNKCLYEATKENEYADKYLGLVRKGLSAQLHPQRRDGVKEAVVMRLDNAFPQFLIERPGSSTGEEGAELKASRGLAIVDMAVIRAAADSAVTLEITTRSDTLRFDTARYRANARSAPPGPVTDADRALPDRPEVVHAWVWGRRCRPARKSAICGWRRSRRPRSCT